MKIARGVAGSSPNFPPNSWHDLTIPQGLLKQFDELNTGNWYG